MIRLLRGSVAARGRDYLVVDVGQASGGVGFKVHTPEPTAARFTEGAAVFLHTHLQVREDNNEPLTPQFVDQKLRQQEQLAQAASAEAQAIANYNIAIANLERAKGTLLRYNNVVLQEQALPKK